MRQRLLQAFQRLAMERRFEEITLADVARQAGLGRATLYRHFGKKDGLMVAALEPLLAALADGGTKRSNERLLTPWISHAWERRWLLRSLLASPSRPAIARRLEELVATRLQLNGHLQDAAFNLTSVGIASAQLAMVHSWVAGEQSLPVAAMVDILLATSGLGSIAQEALPPAVTAEHRQNAARLYAALSPPRG